MAFYDEMAALAVEMLDEFGGPATLVSSAPSASAFNKQTGRATPNPSTSQAIRTVVRPLEIDGEEGRKVTRTVAVLLVAAKAGDRISQGSQVWNVTRVTTVAPIGTAIVHFAEVE